MLACSEGAESKKVAADLQTTEHNVVGWRGRFVRQRLDWLHDEKRPVHKSVQALEADIRDWIEHPAPSPGRRRPRKSSTP